METEKVATVKTPVGDASEVSREEPQVLEEIVIEELSIDGICGVY
jgi:mycofactocin precursor